MDLKEEAILGQDVDRHWYYRSKASALCRYCNDVEPSLVLDVGAGSGFFTKHLLRYTNAQAGLCVDPGYDVDSDEQYSGKRLQFRRSCGTVAADTVLLMDVLEHVEDDRALLLEYVTKVPKGARFLITVPAFDWLWSSHDVFLGHYRRYCLGELERVVSGVGLRVERASYYFGFVLPLAGVMRMSESLRPDAKRSPQSNLRRHSRLVNGALTLICRAELPLLPRNRLGGLSVFCLAHKL